MKAHRRAFFPHGIAFFLKHNNMVACRAKAKAKARDKPLGLGCVGLWEVPGNCGKQTFLLGGLVQKSPGCPKKPFKVDWLRGLGG